MKFRCKEESIALTNDYRAIICFCTAMEMGNKMLVDALKMRMRC